MLASTEIRRKLGYKQWTRENLLKGIQKLPS